LEVNERSAAVREPLSKDKILVVKRLVRDQRLFEVPGRSSLKMLHPTPEVVTLSEPRPPLEEYIIDPGKHECNIIKQVRQAKEACRVLMSLNQVNHALMKATRS